MGSPNLLALFKRLEYARGKTQEKKTSKGEDEKMTRVNELYKKLVLSDNYERELKEHPKEIHKAWKEFRELKKKRYWGGPKKPYFIMKRRMI